MRAIKFRGKAIEGKRLGEWIHGAYLPDFDGYTHRILIVDCITGFSEEVNPITIGQFTGLFDKNGKEVYEGDIIKYIGNEIGDVFTNEIKYNSGGFDPICAICWMSDIEGTKCEVIGNIHDNSELINS